MDIKKLRHLNARHLLKTESDGVNDFAYRIGRSQSLVSAYISERPSKNIGDKMARIIEEAFSKEPGWLDNKHEGVDPEQRRLRDIAAHAFGSNLPPDQQQAIMLLSKIGIEREKLVMEMNQIQIRLAEFSRQAEKQASTLIVSGLEGHGFMLEQTVAERSPDGFYNRRSDEYDLIFLDENNERLGIYIWLAYPRGNRAIMPTFTPPPERLDIEPRVAIFVMDGDEFCFFIVPLDQIADRGRVGLRILPSRASGSLYDAEYKIGRLDITYMMNKFDIEIIPLAPEERRERMRELYRVGLRYLDD